MYSWDLLQTIELEQNFQKSNISMFFFLSKLYKATLLKIRRIKKDDVLVCQELRIYKIILINN